MKHTQHSHKRTIFEWHTHTRHLLNDTGWTRWGNMYNDWMTSEGWFDILNDTLLNYEWWLNDNIEW